LGHRKERARKTGPVADVRSSVDDQTRSEPASLERLQHIFGGFEPVGRHPTDMESGVRRQALDDLAEAVRLGCIPGSHLQIWHFFARMAAQNLACLYRAKVAELDDRKH